MAVATTNIRINVTGIPDNISTFGYIINVNGSPIVYSSGLPSVNKSFNEGASQSVGRIIGLSSTDYDPVMGASSPDRLANLDGQINFGAGFNSTLTDIKKQSNGKFIVSGYFTQYDSNPVNYLCRLNADGSYDPTFSASMTHPVVKVEIDSSDKLYIIGDFAGRVRRLNSNGSIDTSFVVTSGFNNVVNDMHLNPDNTQYYVGKFTTYNGTARARIVRLNSTGGIDTSFNVGTGISELTDNPTAIKRLSDGNVIVAGKISTYNGTSLIRNIMKLSSTGAINTTFRSNIGVGIASTYAVPVRCLTIDSSNNIYVGGGFSTFNGVFRSHFVKLSAAGVDVTPTMIYGFENVIYDIQFDSAGRLWFIGAFMDFDYNPATRLILLNADLTLVSNQVYSTWNSTPTKLYYLQSKEVMIMGGAFTNVQNSSPINSEVEIPNDSIISNIVTNIYNNLNIYNATASITLSDNSDHVLVAFEHQDTDLVNVSAISGIEGSISIEVEQNVNYSVSDYIRVNAPYRVYSSMTASDTVTFKIKTWQGTVADSPLDVTWSRTKQRLATDQYKTYADISNLIRVGLEADVNNYYIEDSYFTPRNISDKEAKWVSVRTDQYLGGVTYSTPTLTYYLATDGFDTPFSNSNMSGKILLNDHWFQTARRYSIQPITVKRKVLRNSIARFHFKTENINSGYISYDGGVQSLLSIVDGGGINSNDFIQSILVDTQSPQHYVDYYLNYYTTGLKEVGYRPFEKKAPSLFYTYIVRFEIIDECKYDDINILFKNRFGFIETLPMNKMSKKKLGVNNEEYLRSIVDYNGDYDLTRHTRKLYNRSGKLSLTLNSELFPEWMNDAFDDLFLSTEVWIVGAEFINPTPCNLKSTDFSHKTVLNDKLIQYTIEVEISQDVINNIR